MYHFEASSPLMFRQRQLFTILVSETTRRHRELQKKGMLRRELHTGEILVVRKQVSSIKKDRVSQTLLFKIKGHNPREF